MNLDDLRRNRNLLFWALHTLGWSGYLITQYLGSVLYEKPVGFWKLVTAYRSAGRSARNYMELQTGNAMLKQEFEAADKKRAETAGTKKEYGPSF